MKIDASLVAVVTGGASGLGEATVRLLASQKAKVVIADLNEKIGGDLAKELGCEFFRTDVTNEDNVIKLFEFTVKKFGKISAVINSAGIISAGMIVSSKGVVVSSDEMLKVLKINVVGTFNVAKHAAKQMVSQE
jgi:NAD(P)-dependent dehydrogenase (short-subunit alcohol dehydrogenase family)